MMSQEIIGDTEEKIHDDNELEPPSWSWIVDINRRLVSENLTDVNDDGDLGYRIDKYPIWRLSNIQEDAFWPQIVSIGSFFSEKSEMDEHKERLLVRRLSGAAGGKEVKLEELVNAMKLLQAQTKACYSNPINASPGRMAAYGSIHPYSLDDEEFIKMMVFDGCFIIEVLRLHWHLTHSSKAAGVVVEDPIFRSSSTIQQLQHDFLVFGNQLPFFVLKELYSLTRSDENTMEPPLRCLAIHFLREFAGSEDVSLLEDDPRADGCHHLLHLFSYACTNKPQRYLSLQDIVLDKKQEKLQVGKKLTYNAKELQEAGVKIKPKFSEEGLMAIHSTKFQGRTMRIQPFYLDNNFVFLLLNFLAFEQGHSRAANPYFTSYIMFLDCLIDSEADVEVLHKAGILNHAFGNNKDVTNIIYRVTRELNDPIYNHFQREMTDLNTYCKAYYGSKWRPWWRNLIRNYFSSPWTITSLVAAIILLVLTFVQTFYTTYAYYKPPN